MTEPMLTFKTVPETGHIGAEQNLAMLDQRHLRRQMISLQNLHMITVITETDVIRPTVFTGTEQPDSVHSSPLQGRHSGDRIASSWQKNAER